MMIEPLAIRNCFKNSYIYLMGKILGILLILLMSIKFSAAQVSDNTRKFYYNEDVRIGQLDSNLFSRLDQLNTSNPANIFDVLDVYMGDTLYNEAAVLYYIGKMRVDYYNQTKPKKLKACEGANITSAEQIFFQTLKPFLRSNIDNYLFILETSLNWLKENEHHYFESKKAEDVYKKFLVENELFLNDLRRNPDKYILMWEEEGQIKN